LEVVRALLEASAEVNHVADRGVTALFVAAQNGHAQVVRTLLEAGAEADHAADEGFTALFAAALKGHVEVVRALLEAGAEVDHAADAGCTALFVAAQNGNAEIVRALLEAGADLNRAHDGVTPLAAARPGTWPRPLASRPCRRHVISTYPAGLSYNRKRSTVYAGGAAPCSPC
jgi:ankyrin repeat protein